MFVALPEPFPAVISRPGSLEDGKPMPDGVFDRADVFGKADSPVAPLAQFLPQGDQRYQAVVVRGGHVLGVHMLDTMGSGAARPVATAEVSASATASAPAAPDSSSSPKDRGYWTPERRAAASVRAKARHEERHQERA